MIAKNQMFVDGQWYDAGDEIWDLGSFEAVGACGKKRHYNGFSKDVGKLPHYASGGSTAFCLDTGALYIYHGKTDAWKLQKGAGGNTEPGGEGGVVNDYQALRNKPSINGVTLEDNKGFGDLGMTPLSNLEIMEIINNASKMQEK